jgi:Protein of unknown function (DUF2845)
MKWLVGSIICCVAVASSALAESGFGRSESGFRCDSGQLVSRGDDMAAVESACGSPNDANQHSEIRSVARWLSTPSGPVREERSVEVTIDEWFYDRGTTRFRRVVQFENGRVVHIGTD